MRSISTEIFEAMQLNPTLSEYYLTDEEWAAFKLEMEPLLRFGSNDAALRRLIDCVAVYNGIKIKLLSVNRLPPS